ncbi:MAG: hypothetical protein ACJ736_08905 [Streptomyces sp.]
MNHSSQERTSQVRQLGQPQYPPQTPDTYGQARVPVETVIEVPNKRLHKYDKVKPGERTVTIRQTGPGTSGEPLAYVHVPRDAPKGGRRARPPFTVSGPNGEPLSTVRSLGERVYEVYGGDGAPVGRITRRGGRTLPWPRRVHWSVQPAQGGEPLAAGVGTRNAWTVFVLISPCTSCAGPSWPLKERSGCSSVRRPRRRREPPGRWSPRRGRDGVSRVGRKPPSSTGRAVTTVSPYPCSTAGWHTPRQSCTYGTAHSMRMPQIGDSEHRQVGRKLLLR